MPRKAITGGDIVEILHVIVNCLGALRTTTVVCKDTQGAHMYFRHVEYGAREDEGYQSMGWEQANFNAVTTATIPKVVSEAAANLKTGVVA